jgi:hypothetical protein
MDDHGNDDPKLLKEGAKILREEAQQIKDHIREEEVLEHDLENKAHELDELAAKDKDHRVKITMVVNGAPTEIHADEDELLSDVRLKALKKSGNEGQPPENWEIKNEAGEMLDPDKTVRHYHFGKEVTLFLSLKAGVAG